MEITLIDDTNYNYFKPFMSEEEWKEADMVIGAIQDGSACGVLAIEEDDILLRILSLAVTPEIDRQPVYRALLEALDEVAQEIYIDAVVFQYTDTEEEKLRGELLREMDYEQIEDSGIVYATELADLDTHLLEGKEERLDKVVPLSQVTGRMWNRFLNLSDAQREECDILELQAKGYYDADCSFLLMNGAEPAGCLLFERVDEDYILDYLCVFGEASPLDMMTLFRASYQEMKSRDMTNSKIYMNAITDTIEKMIMKLTNNKAQKIGNAVTWVKYY